MMGTQSQQNRAAADGTSILFLGTGAGDWPKTVPPEEQEYTGNRDYRRFSAALVNDNILIDFGPTLSSSLVAFQVDVQALTDVLLTHSHWDHLDAGSLQMLVEKRPHAPALRLWCHTGALERLPRLAGIELHPLEVGAAFQIGRYQIEPLAGNHWVEESPREQPLHFLFTTEQEQWIYAIDGAWFITSAMRRLEKTHLDAMVLDGTYGDIGNPLYKTEMGEPQLTMLGQFGHNTLAMIRLMLPTLLRGGLQTDKVGGGILKPNAPIVLTHLSKGWHPSQEELEHSLAADGLIPAYDGLRVHFTVCA